MQRRMGGFASPPISPVPYGDRNKHILEVTTMANCKNCKDNEQIPQQSKDELAFAFAERMVKRLWIALCIAIALAVAAPLAVHFGWLYYESKYETIEYSYEQDGEGTNIIGDGNDVDNVTNAEDQVQEEKENIE